MSFTYSYELQQQEERERWFALAAGSEILIVDMLKKTDYFDKKPCHILFKKIWDDLEKTMTDVLDESGSGMLPEFIRLSMTFI